MPFLVEELLNKQIKILVNGEIKKTNPFLWRAVEDTFLSTAVSSKKVKKTAKK